MVGHDQCRIVKGDAERQARRIDGLHLVVPGDQVAQSEELGPVGPAPGHGDRVLERPVADGHGNRPATTHLPPHALKQLVVNLRRRQRTNAK